MIKRALCVLLLGFLGCGGSSKPPAVVTTTPSVEEPPPDDTGETEPGAACDEQCFANGFEVATPEFEGCLSECEAGLGEPMPVCNEMCGGSEDWDACMAECEANGP